MTRGTRTHVPGVGWVRSKYEAECLAWLKRNKACFTYETTRLAYALPKVYTPDIDIELEDGRMLYVEAKGRFTGADRTKMLAVQAAHPQRDIRLLFMDPSAKLTKVSSTTYADWCRKHGFQFSDGPAMPDSWLAKMRRAR